MSDHQVSPIILRGEYEEIMTELPENSIDCVITDLSTTPIFTSHIDMIYIKKVLQQTLRVQKPGGLMFIIGDSHQNVMWRTLQLLDDIGFEMKQSFITYIYKQGDSPYVTPIYMVNKPLSEKTIVDNVLKWGTGVMNVDACRIPFDGQEDTEIYDNNRRGITERSTLKQGDRFTADKTYDGGWAKRDYTPELPKGRFPANLLVSDRAIDTGEITESKHIEKPSKCDESANTWGGTFQRNRGSRGYDDSGDQSRFFDLDVWFKEHIKLGTQSNTNRFVRLTAYLIELGCHSDGIVLDPFAVTETTCMVAKLLNRKYIGITPNKRTSVESGENYDKSGGEKTG